MCVYMVYIYGSQQGTPLILTHMFENGQPHFNSKVRYLISRAVRSRRAERLTR